MCVKSAGDFVNGKRTGVTLFLGDAFELHLSTEGRLSQGEKMLSKRTFKLSCINHKCPPIIILSVSLMGVFFFCRLSVPFASHAVFVGSELGFYKLWSEEFGFAVTIDNAANIALTMTKHHANRTCGLCGNFNSVTADEYTAQEGKIMQASACQKSVTVCVCRICEESSLLLGSRK